MEENDSLHIQVICNIQTEACSPPKSEMRCNNVTSRKILFEIKGVEMLCHGNEGECAMNAFLVLV